jgi:isopentenyl-diphosphate Delta-isomerase
VTAAALDTDVATRPERYTPWLKLEWARLRGEAWSTVQQFLAEHRR